MTQPDSDFGYDATGWENLENLIIPANITRWPPNLPTGLKSLNMSGSLVDFPVAGDDQPELPVLPFLEEFAAESMGLVPGVTNVPSPTPDDLKKLLAPSIEAGNLRVLCMGNPNCVNYDLTKDLDFSNIDSPEGAKSVTDLSVYGMGLKEQKLIEYVDLFPNVKRLNISQTKAGGAAIKHFVDRGIRHLQITDCNVAQDAKNYAVAHGCEWNISKNMLQWLKSR